MENSVSSSLPSHIQVPYTQPDIPNLLSLASYLYLLSCTSSVAGSIINAPLLGPLITAILLGPELGGLLTPAIQETLITLGYIGLVLIVFEAGLTTHIPLLIENAGLSTMVALTGIMLPLALSMATFKGAWGYGGLQAFAAGAALCSTSLGTTIALLTPELRKTRVGSVLMAAALLDDVVGLVIAGIISGLAGADSGVKGEEVVRPLLVSFAFGFGTPMLALVLKKLRVKWPKKQRSNAPASSNYMLHSSRVQLFIVVLILSAFVAGSRYAGTSDLFGAYLAGAFLSYLFDEPHPEDANSALVLSTPTLRAFDVYLQPILVPLLEPIFFSSIGTSIPVKSLVTTYPSSTTNYDGKRLPSHRVVWRGMVYALLMVLGKMAVGLWFLVWPGSGSISRFFRRHLRGCADAVKTLMYSKGSSRGRVARDTSPPSSDITKPNGICSVHNTCGERFKISSAPSHPTNPTLDIESFSGPPNAVELDSLCRGHAQTEKVGSSLTVSSPTKELTHSRGALLLGIAMVARGEIALIVAQLARPLLLRSNPPVSEGITTTDEEPFAIVIWAILISTFGGAMGVGILLKTWQRNDQKSGVRESTPTAR